MMTTSAAPTTTDYVLAPDADPAECYQFSLISQSIERGVVYLLHFDSPISPNHTAQHYIGWTSYLPARAMAHMQGRGARLTQVARQRGISFVIARTWSGDRHFERKLKNRKEGPTLCPICSPKILANLDAIDAML